MTAYDISRLLLRNLLSNGWIHEDGDHQEQGVLLSFSDFNFRANNHTSEELDELFSQPPDAGQGISLFAPFPKDDLTFEFTVQDEHLLIVFPDGVDDVPGLQFVDLNKYLTEIQELIFLSFGSHTLEFNIYVDRNVKERHQPI
ncbi:hypothetical protein [Pelagimonas phthalicica]|nr:hypothetical protein [Pelagimonas phthalicica]